MKVEEVYKDGDGNLICTQASGNKFTISHEDYDASELELPPFAVWKIGHGYRTP